MLHLGQSLSLGKGFVIIYPQNGHLIVFFGVSEGNKDLGIFIDSPKI
ncbi:MAG: hypothetical protein KGD58_16720 [Candidatus Lokiarchaeota archaeon]|nr:hypothetical protein [Candidatus Lokiarchaeota archaeon]